MAVAGGTTNSPSRGSGMSKEVEAALDEIYNEEGELTEDNVLKAARLKSSPLHEFFEWDNNKAAAEYRRLQARSLIVNVTVTIVDNDGQERRHRVYESTWDPESEEPTSAWQRREDVEKSHGPEFFERTMRREWKGFYNRWADNKKFWKMVDHTRDTGEV